MVGCCTRFPIFFASLPVEATQCDMGNLGDLKLSFSLGDCNGYSNI